MDVVQGCEKCVAFCWVWIAPPHLLRPQVNTNVAQLIATEEWARAAEQVARRGPDYQESGELSVNGCTVAYCASVLSLRGAGSLTRQPFRHGSKYTLWFNGELYDRDSVKSAQNDGQLLFVRLVTALERDSASHDINIRVILSSLQGEWALAFLDHSNSRLYFGRDCLGRRSLVWNKGQALITNSPLIISSIGVKIDANMVWEEVPANGYHVLHISSNINIEKDLFNVQWPLSKQFTLEKSIPSIPLDTFYSSIHYQSTLSQFSSLLEKAVRKRTTTIPHHPNKTRLGILFSGGLDCTVLALFSHVHVPINEPIDLLTVAFQNPRTKADDQYEACPDRITARQGLFELKQSCPGREWRLVCINVSMEECETVKERVMACAAPCTSVMDLSIAIAFWFAARGNGFLDGTQYTSTVKVLLSGLGADEQLGGYGRHQGKYLNGGWEAFIDELQLDIDRLPNRNLGRDDRIVGDHGREIRFPYLDEEVVRFLCELKVHYKCNPNEAKGTGDKILLRMVAKMNGLDSTSKEPKRAVQFGARSAKMGNRKEKGTDIIELS